MFVVTPSGTAPQSGTGLPPKFQIETSLTSRNGLKNHRLTSCLRDGAGTILDFGYASTPKIEEPAGEFVRSSATEMAPERPDLFVERVHNLPGLDNPGTNSMSFEALSLHRHRFQVGKPTPYGIFDGASRLLLARGHALESEEQLDRLIDREATVDMREVDDTVRKIANARPEHLPGFWDESIGAIGRVLRANPGADFTSSLDDASRSLSALIERDPDLAILQAVRGDGGGNPTMYASRHAVHTATAACLAAKRLGWSAERGRCVLRASLTMNISMTELQNQLVNQTTPVMPMQRSEINSHPERSARLLELAGVTDADWLEAVRQHHENESGGGYPLGLSKVSEVAQLVHCADTFTAKLSQRAQRQPMLADKAARLQFQASCGNVMTAALIKEFGLYPPGCAVRLKCGEIGVVMRRGAGVNTPIVAVLLDRSGDPLLTPGRRDASKDGFGIVAVIPMSGLKVRISLEKLINCAPE